MRKILKKVSASLILILMIFSVAFNVLNYSYSVYATSTNPTTQISNIEENKDYTDVNAGERVVINNNSSLSPIYPHLSTKMVEMLGEADSRRYNDLLEKIEVTCRNIVSSFPNITLYDCTEDDEYTVEKHGNAALYVDGAQGKIIYVQQIRDVKLLHECGHILNRYMTGLKSNVGEMMVAGYMVIINEEANKIYNNFPTMNIVSNIIGKTVEEYQAGLAIYAYYENQGYERMKAILPQINNCSSPKDAIAKIVEISGKTSKECFGTYTEQLVSWGLLELVEDEEKADGEIEIGEMEITQPNGDGNGIFNSEKGDTITIQIKVDGVESEEDITKTSVKLDGFKVEKTKTTIDKNGQATVTITMKKTEDIELEEGETTGKVTIIANGKTITETFDIEITNEEKVEDEENDEITIKYHDGEKYVTIGKNTKELNITADGRYVFSVKMSGIEEGETVFAVIGNNEYKFGNSNGSYVKGITFKQNGTYNIKLCVSNIILKELTLNVTIVSENKYLVLYSLQHKNDLDISESWDQGVTEEYSFGNHGTGGENYFIFTDVKDPKKSYFCFKHGASLDPSDHYVLYDAKEYTNLEDKHKLILAYLAETKEFSSESDRYAAQQYYIWLGVKGQQVNCGKFTELLKKLMTLPNNKNDYIDVNKGTITVNGETKKVNLDTFKAIEYIARAQYSYDGEIFELGEYVQPFFTYEYELGDTPVIQLKKENEEGKGLAGATFRVCHKNEQEKWVYDSTKDEYTTNEEGLTDVIPVEEGEYFVYEIKAPGTYKPTSQYAIITVNKEGECEYKIYEAKSLKDDGSVKNASENDSEPTGELDWNSGETEEDSKIKLILEVTNKTEKTDLELELLKIDASTGEPLSGVSFTINMGELYSGTLTTGPDGKAKTKKIDKEKLKPGTYQGTLTEGQAPEGYKEIKPINFTVIITEDGTIIIGGLSSSDASVSTNATDELITATFTIRNTKDEPGGPGGPGEPGEPDTQNEVVELPLLMSISGKVWLDQPQGKNSETNGKYDEGSDKLLEGITVKLYEEDGETPAKFADLNKVLEMVNNEKASKYIGGIEKLNEEIGKISSTNETETDDKGEFCFGGLDPAKSYTIEFEYNGMRYQEIMASIGVEGCGTPSSIQTTAKAVEDEDERKALTQMFSEIGPYPNNYSGGLVFTQTEVEEYIQNKKLPQGVSASQMERFIEDTKIHAKIEKIGGILGRAEQALVEHNSNLYDGIPSSFKFPVVKTRTEEIGYLEYDQWVAAFNAQYLHGGENIGFVAKAVWYYRVIRHQKISHDEINGHQEITQPSVIASTFDYQKNIKGKITEPHIEEPKLETGGPCGWVPPLDPGADPSHYNPIPCRVPVYYDILDRLMKEESEFQITIFYVDEGYGTSVEQNGNKWTRIATFDIESEPLYDHDEAAEKDGKGAGIEEEDKIWGWEKLTGINDNKITKPGGTEGLGKLYNMLVEKIEELEPKDQDLCLVYRPTVDLGLYDDVQKAVVTINKQTETYVYDKRAANGGIFKFGVNEYDIENGRNAKGNVEAAYADYYQSLSDGNPDPGKNAVTEKSYEDIGIRKEDININTEGNGSITTNGTAIAGGYNDYDVSIEMTYRIKIFNQSAVSARVTNILDYYLDTFTFDGVYSDANCTQKIADGTPTTGTSTTNANYNAVNIDLGSLVLKGNGSYEIFVKLHMTEPKKTLGGNVLDAGYKTFNYAEINGYGTNIGVIDIDSSPGDLRPENRFENGPYDDDEGKSPTLIFKNPENASRKMSGIVFEDVDTGKLEIKSYTEQTRAGDGTYTQGSDKPVAGAIVELVEIKEDGTPYDSPTDIEPGIRAQTLTKEDGTYEFDKIVASNYILRFSYGKNYETVLTKRNQVNGLTLLNEKSYNGESYENTKENQAVYSGIYWYTNTTDGQSYAIDDGIRRQTVTNNFAELTNEKAEYLNSYKDKEPVMSLVDQLKERANMFAETKPMLLDVEYHPRYENKIVQTDEGAYEKTYVMENLNFGIQERERAELQITKKVSEISIVDSAGRKITGGTPAQIIAGEVKYIKMIQNNDNTGEIGFADLEIDTELLSGATLKITYEITVTNKSEAGNTIKDIQVIDYVSNNLNFDTTYGENARYNWTPVTVQNLMNSGLLNKTSLETDDETNRIDLLSYQTILTTTFDEIAPGKPLTKTLTLEKNLSAQEESDFNYANQVEIVKSYNSTGRGDYSSIYGNLDPETYTSRQGNLNWETINTKNENGYPQEKTAIADTITGPAIREAEKDSGNAEEVIITPPTGAKGIVFLDYHYVLALISLITIATTLILMKKYIKIQQ